MPAAAFSRRSAERAKPGVFNAAVFDEQVVDILRVDSEFVYVMNIEILQHDVGGRRAQDFDSIAEPSRLALRPVIVRDFQIFDADVLRAAEGNGGHQILLPDEDGTISRLAANRHPGVRAAGCRREDVGVVFAQDVASA